MGIEQHIERLKKDETKAQGELGRIHRLRQTFPDLEADTDRWGRVRYMAKSANARVDHVMIHRNCGCCPDSPIHARPYLKFEGEEIYSNPCSAMVGRPSIWGYGFEEDPHWRKAYEDAGINPQILAEIQRYVDSRKEDDEDEDEEGDV